MGRLAGKLVVRPIRLLEEELEDWSTSGRVGSRGRFQGLMVRRLAVAAAVS